MKKLIIANWKMNPQKLAAARELFSKIRASAKRRTRVRAVVCPPYVFMGGIKAPVRAGSLALGAQDVFFEEEGAFTGEVSAQMLKDAGARYVILGHSERRARGETDEIVGKKLRACLKNALTPVVCIGERERDKEGEYLGFLAKQIERSLGRLSRKDVGRFVLAYEPIWAVGAQAKCADTPENLFEVTIFIKKILTRLFGKKAAFSVPVLYGGSVNADNAEAFLMGGGVSGMLVGRASLDPRVFAEILKMADKVKTKS